MLALLVQLCWHCWCSYAALSVCCTISIAMLYYRYGYAVPSVPGCYTFLVPFFQFVYSLRVLLYSRQIATGMEDAIIPMRVSVRAKSCPHTYPHTLCRCLSVCYGKKWGCEGKKRKTFFKKITPKKARNSRMMLLFCEGEFIDSHCPSTLRRNKYF